MRSPQKANYNALYRLMSSRGTAEKKYLSDAWGDTRSDLEEISFLLGDSRTKLQNFLSTVRKVKRYISSQSFEDSYTQTQKLLTDYRIRFRSVDRALLGMNGAPSVRAIGRFGKLVAQLREFLRNNQVRMGALITSTDWQSPSFLHSGLSQAGRQTNTIYATINDYKRDQHWDAYHYEQAFLHTNIDALVKFPIQVLATSSGMAAFTTILNFLLLEHKSSRPVLVGKSSWFQNRMLLVPAYGKQIVEFDETDEHAILSAVKRHNPSIIFIDSLTNSPEIAVPELSLIIKYLVQHTKEDTYLVIDNTGLAVALQPFRLLLGKRSKLHIIGFESLNKYHQFGMDRVTGGIIYSSGGDTAKLFDYRVHCGTNIPDIVAASLPAPKKNILTGRLARHQRNALILARGMQEWISCHPKSPFSEIVYPGLPGHPSYSGALPLSFTGSFFAVRFRAKYQTVAVYKRFISAVIKSAKKHGSDVAAGSSFGLNGTRVYLTAVRSRPAAPFVRIAAGTEDRMTTEAIKTMFLDALDRFR
jgi:cystathionine beta-lyase/cystathionine gamma-synthase